MDTQTGEIHELIDAQRKMVNDIVGEERLIPIERDLTASEQFYKQIRLYEPCGCGSGKKFKFCCHRK